MDHVPGVVFELARGQHLAVRLPVVAVGFVWCFVTLAVVMPLLAIGGVVEIVQDLGRRR